MHLHNIVLLLITAFAGYVSGAVGATFNTTMKKLVATVFALATTTVLALLTTPVQNDQTVAAIVAANIAAVIVARFLAGRLGDRLQGIQDQERLGVELWRVRAWRDLKVQVPQACHTAATAAEVYWLGYWQSLAQKELGITLPSSALTSAGTAADAYVTAWWHKRAKDVFGVPLPVDANHAPLAVAAYEQLAQQLGAPVPAK